MGIRQDYYDMTITRLDTKASIRTYNAPERFQLRECLIGKEPSQEEMGSLVELEIDNVVWAQVTDNGDMGDGLFLRFCFGEGSDTTLFGVGFEVHQAELLVEALKCAVRLRRIQQGSTEKGGAQP